MIKIGQHLYAGPEYDLSKFTLMIDLGPATQIEPPPRPRVNLDRDEAAQLQAELSRWLHDAPEGSGD